METRPQQRTKKGSVIDMGDMPEPRSDRKRYYNPLLDPRTQDVRMTDKMREAARDGRYNDGTVESGGPLNEPDELHVANLVSSLCDDGLHRPALDIDIPMTVISSSTEGHCHLYFPTVELEWWQYAGLITALAQVGILEPKYVAASMMRGQTLLRPPGVPK